jgi:hypothetical protein
MAATMRTQHARQLQHLMVAATAAHNTVLPLHQRVTHPLHSNPDTSDGSSMVLVMVAAGAPAPGIASPLALQHTAQHNANTRTACWMLQILSDVHRQTSDAV